MARDIESRLARVERELTRLESRLVDEKPWWQQIRGTFKDDAIYEAAMKAARAERRR